MEEGILRMIVSWLLTRLMERNTWVTWLSVLAAKFGVVLTPEFDNMLVNAALALVAVAGYAWKGSPLFTKKDVAK